MMTNNPVYLKKALQWSAYSNKLFETPYVLDIAILKEQGLTTNKHDETLNKIKKGTLD